MTDHDDPIGKIIKQAMDDGKFDNLSGTGKPFPKDENPYEDPADWAAHRVLKASGFSLPWIEERKDIEQCIVMARASLIRSWLYHRDNPQGPYNNERWKQAEETFREKMTEANKLIQSYNLKTPAAELHLFAVDIEAEIERAKKS